MDPPYDDDPDVSEEEGSDEGVVKGRLSALLPRCGGTGARARRQATAAAVAALRCAAGGVRRCF